MASFGLILLTCLLQVGAHVQAGQESNPTGQLLPPGTPAHDNPDVIKLFAYKNEDNKLDPEASSKLLSILVKTEFGADKFGVRSKDNIKTLVELSKVNPEKCNGHSIGDMIHQRNQHVVYRSLYGYIAYYLAQQVDLCKKHFSEKLQQQLMSIPVEKRQAFDKVVKLREIIGLLMQDEIIKQAEGNYRVDDLEKVAVAMDQSGQAAIDTLVVDIPQGIFEHGLATYLTESGFVPPKHRWDFKKKTTEYINREFGDAIVTMNTNLRESMSLYRQLKQAAPSKLKDYDDKHTLINFQLVDLLSESRYNAANISKWMPKKQESRGILSRLCFGHSSVKD